MTERSGAGASVANVERARTAGPYLAPPGFRAIQGVQRR